MPGSVLIHHADNCRRVAAWRRYCAVAVMRMREQHARAQMVQTFKSWQQVASHGADRRAQMRKAVKRMGLSHQRAYFHGWRAQVDLKQVMKYMSCAFTLSSAGCTLTMCCLIISQRRCREAA